jgi:hypothetical protein
MTPLDALQYSAKRARMQRNIRILAAITAFIVLASPWWWWKWPEEYRVNKFLSTVQTGDYASAYAQWNHDPQWKEHPEHYSTYTFDRFMQDWGPRAYSGGISEHHIAMSKIFRNGVVVGVVINGGETPQFLFVDHTTKQISFSPFQFRLGTKLGNIFYKRIAF